MYIIKNLTDGNYFSFRLNEPSLFTDNFEIVSRFKSEGEAMLCIENYIDSNEGFERFGMIDCEVIKEISTTPIDRRVLSAKFSSLISENYTTEQLAEVCRLNNTPDYKNVCATHNYYDANEFMGEAFKAVFGRDIDLQNPAECNIWSEAWNESKAANFNNYDRDSK